MNYRYPYLFVVLQLIGIAWLIWATRRKGREVVVPFDGSKSGSGRVMRFVLWCTTCWLPFHLLFIASALACGPSQLSEPKTQRVLSNIELCVDVSGSMTAAFGEGNRYDASMAAINEFLDYREGDAFGLTFFGNEVLHWVPLTTDVSAIRCAPPFMEPTNPNRPSWLGGTAIGKALKSCRKQLLQREEGDRMIVLVSDGQSYDLNGGADMEIAKRFNDERITVYGIHIGGGAAPGPVVNITTLTGGEVFEPGDPEALSRVFKAIDEMAETKMEKSQAETMDDYFALCVFGLILVGMSLLSQFGLRYTPW